MAHTPALCRRLENQGYHIEHNFGHGELPSRSQEPDWHKAYSSGVAFRSGTPIEIVSKVILRHSNLSTTFSLDISQRHNPSCFLPAWMISTLLGTRFVCDYLTKTITFSEIPKDSINRRMIAFTEF
jgi:hypothetical protein